MQKQLSKKSHKPTQSSIDDFMKHIRKYNLQSERHISPKPLLYMYTNPSRHFTLQTLQKSRSKSKTLSNRQHSHSKKSSSKTIRQKVQKMLSLSKKQNIHKKSVSSISNKNQKSIKKLNKSTAQIDLTKSKHKIKHKLNEFKLKPMTTSNKKNKRSKTKLQQNQQKFTDGSPIGSGFHQFQVPSDIDHIQLNKQNPAELIEMYSKKLFKVQLYLQANKNKLGSMLCRKFQQILNQIVQSLVQNLKKSLNQLEVDIEKRLAKQFQKQFDKSMMEKEEQIRTIQKVCQKITKKFSELLHKQHYANSLIYNLRLRGIDIDNEFGRAVWGVQNLGGIGYGKSQLLQEQDSNASSSTHRGPREEKLMKQIRDNDSQGQFQFCEHPKAKLRKQNIPIKQKNFQKQDLKLVLKQKTKIEQKKQLKQQDQLTRREQEEYQFRIRSYREDYQGKNSI